MTATIEDRSRPIERRIVISVPTDPTGTKRIVWAVEPVRLSRLGTRYKVVDAATGHRRLSALFDDADEAAEAARVRINALSGLGP